MDSSMLPLISLSHSSHSWMFNNHTFFIFDNLYYIMTTTSRAYFGQDGVLSISKGSDTIELAIVQNWKATVTYETSDLYGIGSIYRQAAARHNAKVDVSAEFCAIPDTLEGSLIGYVIDPVGGSGDSTATGADTTALARFTFTGTFTAEDGVHKKTITVGDVYMSSFPWEASTGEWIKVNMEGTGSTYKIEDVNPVPPGP